MMNYRKLLGNLSPQTTLYRRISGFLSQHSAEPNVIVNMMLYFASPSHRQETSLFATHLSQVLGELQASSPEDYQFILNEMSVPTADNSGPELLEALFEEGNLFAIREYICKIPLPLAITGYQDNLGNTLLHRLATVFKNININSEGLQYGFDSSTDQESPSSYLAYARDILVFLSSDKEYVEMLRTNQDEYKYIFNHNHESALDIFLEAYHLGISRNTDFEEEVPFLDELILLYPKTVLLDKLEKLTRRIHNESSNIAYRFGLNGQIQIFLGRLRDDDLLDKRNKKSDSSEKISEKEISNSPENEESSLDSPMRIHIPKINDDSLFCPMDLGTPETMDLDTPETMDLDTPETDAESHFNPFNGIFNQYGKSLNPKLGSSLPKDNMPKGYKLTRQLSASAAILKM